MIHDHVLTLGRRSLALLAAARTALRRLPATDPWLRLVRPGEIETAPPLCVVLLHHLPGLMDRAGKGGLPGG